MAACAAVFFIPKMVRRRVCRSGRVDPPNVATAPGGLITTEANSLLSPLARMLAILRKQRSRVSQSGTPECGKIAALVAAGAGQVSEAISVTARVYFAELQPPLPWSARAFG